MTEGDLSALATRLAGEAAGIDRELGEIDMLIAQARTEAGRHETKRAEAAAKLAKRPADDPPEAAEVAELAAQVATLTKRAAVMESQVDVLEGKQRALTRFRDATSELAREIDQLARHAPPAVPWPVEPPMAAGAASKEADARADARSILGAQEELRRQIARSLHDGPVQGLTNIALQAQIVERLAERSPEQAATEAQALVAMVQSTLDTTKTFLFDVRPMVLDDLGLVPTLRRASRERTRAATATVDVDSRGQDQRMAGEVESSVFRIVDDALVGFLETGADRVAIGLEWMDRLLIVVAASRDIPDADSTVPAAPPAKDLPPALAEMIEDRRLAHRPHLADGTWRAIRARAEAIGATVEIVDEGSELRLTVPIADRA